MKNPKEKENSPVGGNKNSAGNSIGMLIITLIIVKHLVADYPWPTRWSDRMAKVNSRKGKLIPNTDFPTPWSIPNVVTDTDFATDAADFTDKQTNVKTDGVPARDNSWDTIKLDYKGLLTMVQNKMDKNPALAAVIAGNAGATVRTHTRKLPQINEVYPTEVSGTILATADKQGYHEWKIKDKNNVVTILDATKKAHILIPGLSVGDHYDVYNRKIGDGSDWVICGEGITVT